MGIRTTINQIKHWHTQQHTKLRFLFNCGIYIICEQCSRCVNLLFQFNSRNGFSGTISRFNCVPQHTAMHNQRIRWTIQMDNNCFYSHSLTHSLPQTTEICDSIWCVFVLFFILFGLLVLAVCLFEWRFSLFICSSIFCIYIFFSSLYSGLAFVIFIPFFLLNWSCDFWAINSWCCQSVFFFRMEMLLAHWIYTEAVSRQFNSINFLHNCIIPKWFMHWNAPAVFRKTTYTATEYILLLFVRSFVHLLTHSLMDEWRMAGQHAVRLDVCGWFRFAEFLFVRLDGAQRNVDKNGTHCLDAIARLRIQLRLSPVVEPCIGIRPCFRGDGWCGYNAQMRTIRKRDVWRWWFGIDSVQVFKSQWFQW